MGRGWGRERARAGRWARVSECDGERVCVPAERRFKADASGEALGRRHEPRHWNLKGSRHCVRGARGRAGGRAGGRGRARGEGRKKLFRKMVVGGGVRLGVAWKRVGDVGLLLLLTFYLLFRGLGPLFVGCGRRRRRSRSCRSREPDVLPIFTSNLKWGPLDRAAHLNLETDKFLLTQTTLQRH